MEMPSSDIIRAREAYATLQGLEDEWFDHQGEPLDEGPTLHYDGSIFEDNQES